MMFPPMHGFYNISPSLYSKTNEKSTSSMNSTYSNTDSIKNKNLTEKKEDSNSFNSTHSHNKESRTYEKTNTKNFPFDLLDKILSHVEGDDLIILGVICLLYKSDDKDIFLIIILLMLLFDI